MRARHSQKRIGGWLFVVGLFIAFLGMLAIIYSFTATKVTIILLAALLLLAGLVEGGQALVDRGIMCRSRLFSGFIYTFFGLILLFDPIAGAIGLTMLLALFLLVSGIGRLLLALSLVHHNLAPGWHLLVAGVNILLAILILLGWPETGNWLIGFVVGLELLLAGALTAFATSGIDRGHQARDAFR